MGADTGDTCCAVHLFGSASATRSLCCPLMNCDDFDQEVLRIARAPAQTRPRPPPPGNAEVPARLDGPSSADIQGTQPKKSARILDSKNILLQPISLELPAGECIAALLAPASALFEMEAKRIFSTNGAEYSLWWSTEHIAQGEVLVFTDGPPFLPHTMSGVAMALAGDNWREIPKPTPDFYLLK